MLEGTSGSENSSVAIFTQAISAVIWSAVILQVK